MDLCVGTLIKSPLNQKNRYENMGGLPAWLKLAQCRLEKAYVLAASIPNLPIDATRHRFFFSFPTHLPFSTPPRSSESGPVIEYPYGATSEAAISRRSVDGLVFYFHRPLPPAGCR